MRHGEAWAEPKGVERTTKQTQATASKADRPYRNSRVQPRSDSLVSVIFVSTFHPFPIADAGVRCVFGVGPVQTHPLRAQGQYTPGAEDCNPKVGGLADYAAG